MKKRGRPFDIGKQRALKLYLLTRWVDGENFTTRQVAETSGYSQKRVAAIFNKLGLKREGNVYNLEDFIPPGEVVSGLREWEVRKLDEICHQKALEARSFFMSTRNPSRVRRSSLKERY